MKHCPQCQKSYAKEERVCASDGAWLSLPDPYHLLGKIIANKYRVEALVGVGGIGAVYRARHLGIDRPVAVKILQPNIVLDDERWLALFEREAKLAGRLAHENIANVIDAGHADGVAYMAMEWLDGVTLQEELAGGEKFSFERIAALLWQIAAALEAAHAERIIHRDLKPANLMVIRRADGREQVKALDFGIAKLADATTAASVSAPLGTPHYASPEQFQRGGQIDQRSDIYSLGVLLYQMLTGELPFNATSAHELISMQMTALPPPIRKLRPETPIAMERLVNRLLAKDPAQRPQSISEIPPLFEAALNVSTGQSGLSLDTVSLGDLMRTQEAQAPQSEGDSSQRTADSAQPQTSAARAPITRETGLETKNDIAGRRGLWAARRQRGAGVALALLGLVSIVAFLIWKSRHQEKPESAVKTIAVLPFKPLLPSPDDEMLGVGMTHTLITRIGSLKQIAVRPTDAVMKYAARDFDPMSVGRELEVETLLVGRIQHVGERLRVTVQLLNTRDGTQRWAESFDERYSDLFKVQDVISSQVAEALLAQLTGEDKKRLARRDTENTEANQLYLKARIYWERRSQEGFKKGIDYLQQALEKDPNYALAHSGLANSYALSSMFGFVPPRDAMPKAEAAAKHALELDESLVEAHIALSLVRANYDWNWPAAERGLRRAIELNPNYPGAHHLYALILAAQGRFAEAQEELQSAQRLDPRSLNITAAKAWVSYLMRQYARARSLAEEALAQNPNFYPALQQLGQAYEREGKYNEAISVFQKARALSGDSTFAVARLGHVYAQMGRRKDAEQLRAKLMESANRSFGVAWVYLGLGDHDHALEWLQRAMDDRASELIYLKVDPIYDGLRDDARFDSLLRRVGLAN
ncbi:MAG TPA: protein kinase [Blastocatellia bacterium]|nr:protein kinase [Blastocatellia bacterium]